MPIPKVDTRRARGPLAIMLVSERLSDNKEIYSQNDWYLEAGFIITFDVHGNKRATKLSSTIKEILEKRVDDGINVSRTALGN